tara:strand:- start:359 stop:640 length:282 start_codon:yes stop_codon:yes gene_type:complete
MNLKIKQSNSFKKSIKKLPREDKLILDNEVKRLSQDPTMGEQKKGDLGFLRVHKFKINRQEVLLGYMYEEDQLVLTLLKLGLHENFYRDIKRI